MQSSFIIVDISIDESPHSAILSLAWHISDKTLANDLLMSSLQTELQIFLTTLAKAVPLSCRSSSSSICTFSRKLLIFVANTQFRVVKHLEVYATKSHLLFSAASANLPIMESWTFVFTLSGVLMCTDVMGRGVDIPDVNWVIQFDPPSSAR